MSLRESDVDGLDFAKGDGLLPAVVQDALGGALLMVGYMNADALRETLRRGRVVFWSRSKGRLWEKGETSGHRLELVEVRADCDADALRVLARPAGPVCHLGSATCFGDGPATEAERLQFLARLEQIVESRVAAGARDRAASRRRSARKASRWRSPRPARVRKNCSANPPTCCSTSSCC
jgi:phosphoribosyl-ATP pyrophosphohydrolase/phosphoribosyl-AMP cyclohydrolase